MQVVNTNLKKWKSVAAVLNKSFPVLEIKQNIPTGKLQKMQYVLILNVTLTIWYLYLFHRFVRWQLDSHFMHAS